MTHALGKTIVNPLKASDMTHDCCVYLLVFAYSNGHSMTERTTPPQNPPKGVRHSIPPENGIFLRMKESGSFSYLEYTAS